jgi:DNA-binding MarR family transcriptional regulator
VDCALLTYQCVSFVKSATSAQGKPKPQRAASQTGAPTASAQTSQRAVAMQVLKKFRSLFRLANLHSGTEQQRTRVSRAEMWALYELREHPGMRVTQLADAMALRQSTVSNLINKLIQRQLVRRKGDNRDARVVHLYLTASGERVVIKIPSAPHNVLLNTLEHLSIRTLRLLDRELGSVLDRARE